jgi:hypothetical protein
MTMRARFVVLALSLAGTSVSAQSVDSRLSNRLDARTRSAVVAIVDSARALGLPTEPLIDKANEGGAKNGSAQLILSAVRKYMGQLSQARAALGASPTEGEIIGGAQAIRAGIPVSHLEKLRRVRPTIQIATALTVVSDMVAREVPIDTAVSVVASLINAAATDDQLLGVRADVETDILGGRSPALAASMRGHALQQTLAQAAPPNGAGGPGTLPSPSGTNRPGTAGPLSPPPSAVGNVRSNGAPTKPPVTRRP